MLEVDHLNCNRYVFEQDFLSFFSRFPFFVMRRFVFLPLSSNICTFSAFSGRRHTNIKQIARDYGVIFVTQQACAYEPYGHMFRMHTTKCDFTRTMREISPSFSLPLE